MLKPLLIVAVAASLLQGCAGYRSGQRPWDPPQGRAMFEQIPPWDDAARRLCGGHLRPEQRTAIMTDRC